MGRITPGTRLLAICTIAVSSAIAWLPAASASAAPAATSTPGRSASPAHPAVGTSKAVARASQRQAPSAEAAAQAAAKSGVITGTVLGPAGIPLAGICVTVTGPSGRLLAVTNGDGRYIISGPPAGLYTVGYADCASPDSYVAQVYPGGSVDVVSGRRTLLEPVALAAASPLQAIATELAYQQAHESTAAAAAVKYAVTGRVRDKAGKPLAGICVTATGTVDLGSNAHPYYYKFPSLARTGREGRYEIPALPSGFHIVSWQVLFTVGCGNSGNYAPQWWRDAASAGKATVLRAKPRTITGIDATLTEGASIAGIVRGRSATGPGLKGACVQATGIGGQVGVSIEAHTGAGGRYVLHGLGTGSYDVSIAPCNAGNYLSASRGRVSVRVGATRTVSGFLVAGATIDGTVTTSQAAHAPLAGICVYLTTPGGGIQFATTAKSGSYSFIRLAHGTYFVSLTGGCGNSGSYAPQFYRAGASTGSLGAASATRIRLSVGESYPANVAMLPGGTVTGTVTGQPSGRPLSNMCVELIGQPGYFLDLLPPGGPYIPLALNYATTNSAGRYRLPNLQPRLYLADFIDCSSSAYGSTWFAPEGGISPQWLSVAGGAVVAGVDAALPRSGSITGTVTGPAGHGLSNICVLASQQGVAVPQLPFFVYPGVGFSGKTGKYQVSGLAPGQYSVEFAPCFGPYAVQWYKHKAPGSPPTAVQVKPGRTTAAINATMTGGKSVSGVVISGVTGKPVSACLIVSPASLNQITLLGAQFIGTSKSGRFTLEHVVAGIYQVEAYPCGAAPAGLATITTVITIPAGRSTAAIILRLPRAGAIAGIVTAPSVPGGAAYACVEVTTDSGTIAGTAIVNRNGRYAVPDVAPGSYQVQIDDACSGTAALAPQLISPVQVAAGATTGLNSALVANGSITGTVTSSASSRPVAGICVGAFTGPSATEPAAVAITSADGSYQIGYLAPASYLVKFSSGCPATGDVTQWYNDASSGATATPVTVSPGLAHGSVDASMSS